MNPAQLELTATDEMIAVCHARVVDSFNSQSDSRECIRLSHAAIARSREQIHRPFADPRP